MALWPAPARSERLALVKAPTVLPARRLPLAPRLSDRMATQLHDLSALAVHRGLVLRPTEVRQLLQRKLKSGQQRHSWVELPQGARPSVAWTVVRTGPDTGYARATWLGDNTKVVAFSGTRAGWVRIDNGLDREERVVLQVNYQGRHDGKALASAVGTTTTFVREVEGNAVRRTTISETLDRRTRRQTDTRRAGGDRELHELVIDPERAIDERLERRLGDGTHTRFFQHLDLQHRLLRVGRGDAATIDWRERAVREHDLQRVLSNAGDAMEPVEVERYEDGSWAMREGLVEQGVLGTLHVLGRDQGLTGLVSGFVSPLGTPFGELHHRIDQPAPLPSSSATAPNRRIGRWTTRRSAVFQDEVIPLSGEPEKHAAVLEQTARQYRELTGRPLRLVVDPNVSLAVVLPHDGRRVRVNPTLALQPPEVRLLVLSHEALHVERRHAEDPVRGAHAGRAEVLLRLGRRVQHDASLLRQAALGLPTERDADAYAAWVLRLAKDSGVEVDLQAIEDFLFRNSPPTWLPLYEHDRGGARVDLIRRVFTDSSRKPPGLAPAREGSRQKVLRWLRRLMRPLTAISAPAD